MSFVDSPPRRVVRAGEVFCTLDALPDPGSKAFTIARDGEEQEIFVVRRGGDVFAYSNHCPHVGSPLDWQPDVFLNHAKSHIQCATHGALFRIEDGMCIAGPCRDEKLDRVPIEVIDGEVRLAD
jgi:nitrite reductase/ring-hydroxylating ferredoxin subunit